MTAILDRDWLKVALAAQPAQRLVVAYSGGVDSHVLLHLLVRHRAHWPERTLTAIYVDHGLQSASAAWGEHCAAVCRQLAVPFRMLAIDARPTPGESPEAAARRARYTALARELDSESALLTAHHRDDQAETLLLQLLRGAGPHGLAAMPAVSRLGPGWLWRPLLGFDRAALLAYAQSHGLRWIEDSSNADPGFDRNYLRHRILPLLQERWPAANRTLARAAQRCADAAEWLDQEAAAELARAAPDRPDRLGIASLRELPDLHQRNLVRYWLRQLQLPTPDSRQLRQLLHDVLTAGRDRQPCSRWPGVEVRRHRDGLYAMPPLTPHSAGQLLNWRATAVGWPPLTLPGIGTLRLEPTTGTGLCAGAIAEGSLLVRFRQGGERFRPVGRLHGQELKKLLQEADIPPWERDRLPLLYAGPSLLAVVGLGIAADHAAPPGAPAWQVVLQSPSPAGSGIL